MSKNVFNELPNDMNLSNGINKLKNDFNNLFFVNSVAKPTIETIKNIPNMLKKGSNVVNQEINKITSKEEEQLKRAEEKEQSLREHIENREDTKYQRTLSDLRKSGVNPNLFNNINVGQYSSDTSSTLENMLKEELQDEQLSNETFNKILQVVGTIVGALIFKNKI